MSGNQNDKYKKPIKVEIVKDVNTKTVIKKPVTTKVMMEKEKIERGRITQTVILVLLIVIVAAVIAYFLEISVFEITNNYLFTLLVTGVLWFAFKRK